MGGRLVGRMIVGPRFFLIGLTECSLVWTVTHHVTSLAAQEKIFRGFMISLCLADWTQCAWLLGIARPPLSAETAHEPLPAPRSPQRSTTAGTHPASPVTPAKTLAAEGGEVEEREKEKAKGSVRRRARGT
ncbi:hypothetical protein EHS25_008754 [Saitozyma podzolica]|uniref:Uncharacterized protein n=1 Tax=Saitozyma podzolica TaxID=1890683 RepID=A0A427YMR7_9TREE|nr:hypothetical protein EHS25_008754 [Saitozyma podzolica]